MAMLLADELDADWTKVKVQQATGDDSIYGGMGTGGSASTRSTYQQLREMGAAGRHMLIAAAAQKWGVDPSTCTTEMGKVVHKASGKTINYGELTAAASAIAVPAADSVQLKDPSEYRYVGKQMTRIDNPNIVTGKAVFGIDAKVDKMKYAVISRAPAFGATLASFDDSAAKKVPGVRNVLKTSSGVAVVADNTWAAIKGREALKVNWNMGPNTGVSTATLLQDLRDAVQPHQDMPSGAKVIEATYDLPFLAHCTMEPMNATADVHADRAYIWAPTQSPDEARRQAASWLSMPVENVELNVTLLGGGFGRRGPVDYVNEACEVSRGAGCPIKLMWTREDDMKHDFYRPMSHHSLKGAIDSNGNPVGWSHQFLQAGSGRRSRGWGGAGIPYDVPGGKLLYSGIDSPVPTGAWRSVQATQLVFANEVFIDELAHAAGKDPFEFRKSLIKDKRLLTVLETAAEKAGWGTPLPPGHVRGMAVFNGYNSPIAHVVELSVQGNEIKLHRIVACVDPGVVINPKGVEGQIQSGTCDGLSAALRAAITIDKGGVVQNSFDDYRWMTFDAMPPVEVIILNNNKEPGGIGEVGVPSSAPAVANAIFAATGKRVRKLPIKISELV